MMFSALGEPGQTLGGRWSLGGNTLVTTRDNQNQGLNQQGPDTRRLSLNAGWERQLVSNTGLVAQISGLARADMYWADNVINPHGSGDNFNNVLLARQFEQANAVLRYPMGRNGDGYHQLVEPIVALTAAPAVKVDPRQPIEDSLDVEFDETNLFSPNRFTGTDLIEGGSRATYGLRHAITAENGARLDIFGGQSYDFSKNNDFPGLSGLHDQISDYVGRIDFSPGPWLDLNYGARLDHNSFNPQRQDARLSFGVPEFRPSLQYISAFQTETTGIVDQVKEATLGFSSNFTKYWTFTASHTQAFQPDPGPRTSAATLTYNDECFIIGVTVSHNDTDRADVSSGTSATFHFYLKNVGGVHTDSFTRAQFPAEFRQY
jgi:LPS-assembly protein